MMETELPKEPPDKTDSGYQEPTDEPLVAEEDPIAYRTSFTRDVQSMETTLSKEPLDTTDIGSQVSVDKSLATEEDPEELSRRAWAEVEEYAAAILADMGLPPSRRAREQAAEGDNEQ